MNHIPIPALLFFVFHFVSDSVAQDKILKLNGKTTEIKNYTLKGDWLYYVRSGDNRAVQRRMDRYEVFSVIRADGSEEVIYDPDTVHDGDPNIEQVRRYILGQQYAMNNYHPSWTKIGGAASGVGSGFIGFYGPPFVFVYALIAGSVVVKKIPPNPTPDSGKYYQVLIGDKPDPTIDPALFNSEEFISGYRRYARNKIIREGLIWGGIGFAVAFPAFYLIYHGK